MSEKPNEQAPLRTATEAEPAHLSKLKPRPAEEVMPELQARLLELEKQNEALRRAQAELEKSRDRYVDFYDFAPVGYLTLDHEGVIGEINLTGAAMFRMERNKLPHQRFAHFVAAEDRDRWHRHFLSVLTHDDTLTCELALLRGDGSRTYIRLDCLRLSRADKTAVVRIVLADINEHKRSEEAVRAKEEFFRLIAESAEDFIAVLDLEGRRLYNSPSYTKLFGDVEALKGTDSFADIHPDDRERTKRVFKETVQSGIGHRLNFRFVLANGSIRYMESCGGLIRNSQG